MPRSGPIQLQTHGGEIRWKNVLVRPIAPDEDPNAVRDQHQQTRERFREQLRSGRLDARVVEIDVREKSFPSFEIIAGSSVEVTSS